MNLGFFGEAGLVWRSRDAMNFTSEAFLNRTPYCRAWDSLPRHIFDTLVDEGFPPRQTDGELLAVACLRVGNPDESLELGGHPAAAFRPLVWGYDPDDPDIHMVPEDYLMALVAAAAARLPQPLHQHDLEKIRSTLWDPAYQGHSGAHVLDLRPARVHLRSARHADMAQPQEPSSFAPTGAP